ncbi:MAG: DEAD/DEAH box helicase [Saprospiraceae bacterium]|nr:DEAD/DEAH box helicase [Saprospiraceae bacterium]
MLFKELPIIEPILKALETEGYAHPTPIQEQSIPIILKSRDLLGCAQTGTGKTAAFAIPILQLLHQNRPSGQNKRPIRSLILTPTRELAIQIAESFDAYGRHTVVRNQVIFGGVSQKKQTDELRQGTDVLVATPGRLLDLMNQGYVSLSHIEIFVLDEADRMLDMGFIHDVKRVIAKLPTKRQTLFFSATMPPEIATLASSILTDPIRVEVTPVSSTAEKVGQSMYFVNKADKKPLLIHLLQDKEIVSALVFTRTKHLANRVATDLTKAGIYAEAIHGNKSQTARQNALANFKSGRIRVLVATDIAARGIDVEELSHVINFELPNVPETYIHRIGRTGRAGLSGEAISFCEAEELPYLKDIQKLIGTVVPVVHEHPFVGELIAPSTAQPMGRNGQTQSSGRRQQSGQPRSNGGSPQPARRPEGQRNDRPARPNNGRDGTPTRDGRDDRREPSERSERGEQLASRQYSSPRPRAPRPEFREDNDQSRPRPQQPKPAAKPSTTEVASAIRNRFASILEVSGLEKQERPSKPKPNYRDRDDRGGNRSSGTDKKNGGKW